MIYFVSDLPRAAWQIITPEGPSGLADQFLKKPSSAALIVGSLDLNTSMRQPFAGPAYSIDLSLC